MAGTAGTHKPWGNEGLAGLWISFSQDIRCRRKPSPLPQVQFPWRLWQIRPGPALHKGAGPYLGGSVCWGVYLVGCVWVLCAETLHSCWPGFLFLDAFLTLVTRDTAAWNLGPTFSMACLVCRKHWLNFQQCTNLTWWYIRTTLWFVR